MSALDGLGHPKLYTVWRRRDGALREVVGTSWWCKGRRTGNDVQTAEPLPLVYMRDRFSHGAQAFHRRDSRSEPLARFLATHEPLDDDAAGRATITQLSIVDEAAVCLRQLESRRREEKTSRDALWEILHGR